MSKFDQISDDAYVRQSQLVGLAPKKNPRKYDKPSAEAVLPFSGPTLWRKVQAGTFPKPVKFSPRVSALRVGDVRQWLRSSHTA